MPRGCPVVLDDEYEVVGEACDEVSSQGTGLQEWSDQELSDGLLRTAQPDPVLGAEPVVLSASACSSASAESCRELSCETQTRSAVISEGAGLESSSCPIRSWISRAMASYPTSQLELGGRSLDLAHVLAEGLREAGARSLVDFHSLAVDEAMAVWTPFRTLEVAFLAHLLQVLPRARAANEGMATTASQGRRTVGVVSDATAPKRHKGAAAAAAEPMLQAAGSKSVCGTGGVRMSEQLPPRLSGLSQGTSAAAEDLRRWLSPLRMARESRTPPLPHAFADILRHLAALPADAMRLRWQLASASGLPSLPSARGRWLVGQSEVERRRLLEVIQEEALWTELAGWRRSAAQYASAVQLWGLAAQSVGCSPWPPSRLAAEAYAFFFKQSTTMAQYVSHVRAALRLVDAPIGALADTGPLVRGLAKLPESRFRFKPRASADQTRKLVSFARRELLRQDVADSWVIARHFCLRYGAEVVPLEAAGAHSAVEITQVGDELPTVSLTLFQRKSQREPVVVVRRCICALQGKALCGVHVLIGRAADSRVFPHLSYADGLACLKASAARLGFERASEWGTHAFRRGWADEALRAGGPTALFYSGGWRGIAALGYTTAKSRGALAAAEWLVEFSDSSDAV